MIPPIDVSRDQSQNHQREGNLVEDLRVLPATSIIQVPDYLKHKAIYDFNSQTSLT